MRLSIRVILSVIICFLSSVVSQAKDVMLISIGESSSKDEAVTNALVSAVEQAYGVYVSGNTVIFNDDLIRDEIIQIKRGNVKNYTILSATQLPNKNYSVTIEATVSTDMLLEFARSKGAECELAGKSFAANLNLRKIHVANGAEAMKHLYNTLGLIVPKMFDYKLNLDDPIVYGSDVYIPIAVDCVLNSNYNTFEDMYNGISDRVDASIESVAISGDTKDPNIAAITRYRNYILQLPEIWVFGFLLRDNLNNYVIPQLNSSEVKMPENAFWPSAGVKSYKISTNYRGQDYIYGIPPHSYILCGKDIVFKAHGVMVQKLDNEPLCSIGENQSGGSVLKSYVKKFEDGFSKSRAQGFTGVYDIRDVDRRMIDWSDGYPQRTRSHTWIGNPKMGVGHRVCTIHFFICYKDTDISNVTNIIVESINEDSDV